MAQLAEAEAVVREQEVRSLLGSNFSDEAINVMVSRASSLNDEDYAAWRDEKELMVIEMTQARDLDPKAKERLKQEQMKKEGKEAKAGDNPFAALLAQRRSESGTADPDTMRNNPNEPDLINHPGDGSTDVKSGVTPSAPGLSTPRHKIAGSAGDDLTGQLDNAQAEGDVSLAGSQASDDGESVSPFRVLANVVTDANDSDDSKGQAEKPDFDPVS
jgi:hypothetical protein